MHTCRVMTLAGSNLNHIIVCHKVVIVVTYIKTALFLSILTNISSEENNSFFITVFYKLTKLNLINAFIFNFIHIPFPGIQKNPHMLRRVQWS